VCVCVCVGHRNVCGTNKNRQRILRHIAPQRLWTKIAPRIMALHYRTCNCSLPLPIAIPLSLFLCPCPSLSLSLCRWHMNDERHLIFVYDSNTSNIYKRLSRPAVCVSFWVHICVCLCVCVWVSCFCLYKRAALDMSLGLFALKFNAPRWGVAPIAIVMRVHEHIQKHRDTESPWALGFKLCTC